MPGILSKEVLSDTISRPFTLHEDILPKILSISYISLREALKSSLKAILLNSSSTPSNLFSISSLTIRGSSIHLLKDLPPIDVAVLSNTHKREPFLDFSLMLSVSSRFLLELPSIVIKFIMSYFSRKFIFVKLIF